MGRLRDWKATCAPTRSMTFSLQCSWKNSVRFALGRGRQDREEMGAWKTSQQAGPPSRRRPTGCLHKRDKGGCVGRGHGARAEPRSRARPVLSSGRKKSVEASSPDENSGGVGLGKEQDQITAEQEQ